MLGQNVFFSVGVRLVTVGFRAPRRKEELVAGLFIHNQEDVAP